MDKERKLLLVGDSAFAEVAYEYFTHDSIYQVVAFSVEAAYLKRDTLFGLPVVPPRPELGIGGRCARRKREEQRGENS